MTIRLEIKKKKNHIKVGNCYIVSIVLPKGKTYGEVVPVLNSAPSYADKWGNAGKVSGILNLSTRRKSVINFMLNNFTPPSLGVRFGHRSGEKSPSPEIMPHILGHPSPCLVSIMNVLSHLLRQDFVTHLCTK